MDESLDNIGSRSTSMNSSFHSQKKNKKNISQETIDKIIKAINSNLQDIIVTNRMSLNGLYIDNQDIFFLPKVPTISLEDYIIRIYNSTKMDISTLIIAVIYIDLFCEKNKYFLTLNNIHRVLLASCLVSMKFNEDIFINNYYFAKVGGVSNADLNLLEYYFYAALGFKLFLDEDYYRKYFDYFSGYSQDSGN